MSLRYQLGRTLNTAEGLLLSQRWFPLFRRTLGHRNWCYDACRFSGSRDFRTVFDVGANVGHVATEFARFFPRAEIHAFEPIAATFAQLAAAHRSNPRVHPHPLALSDEPGTARIQLQGATELNSLHFQAPAAFAAGETIAITTLDKFCSEQRIETIDLLKVDAQGYDLKVLRGGETLLREQRAPFIAVEASFTPDDATNQHFAPLHAFLTGLDYRVCGMYDQLNYGPRLRYLGCFNLLWVHPAALTRRFPSADAG